MNISLGKFLSIYGKLGTQVLIKHSWSVNSALEALESCHSGQWDSKKEFAECVFDQYNTLEIKEEFRHFINFDKYAEFLFDSNHGQYYTVVVGREYHVFSY